MHYLFSWFKNKYLHLAKKILQWSAKISAPSWVFKYKQKMYRNEIFRLDSRKPVYNILMSYYRYVVCPRYDDTNEAEGSYKV